MYCPKCGSILVPKKEGNKKQIVCSCGYKTSETEDMVIKEQVQQKEKDVEVVDKGELQTSRKQNF